MNFDKIMKANSLIGEIQKKMKECKIENNRKKFNYYYSLGQRVFALKGCVSKMTSNELWEILK